MMGETSEDEHKDSRVLEAVLPLKLHFFGAFLFRIDFRRRFLNRLLSNIGILLRVNRSIEDLLYQTANLRLCSKDFVITCRQTSSVIVELFCGHLFSSSSELLAVKLRVKVF